MQKRRDLDDVSRKLTGLIEAIADGLRAPGLQSRLDELERRKAALAAELEIASPPAPCLHPNLAEVYRKKVADLQTALADRRRTPRHWRSCARSSNASRRVPPRTALPSSSLERSRTW